MIRFITRRRLNTLTTRAEAAEADAAAVGERNLALAEELDTTSAALDAAEQTQQKLLRDLAERSLENAELVEEVKAAEHSPETVYVLSQRGEIHSVHTTHAAARAAAGFPDIEWPVVPAGKRTADYELRITTVPLSRGEVAS